MKEVISILSDFKTIGINISLDDSGSNLKLKGDLSKIEFSHKERLKQNKDSIIEFLKERSVQMIVNIPVSADNSEYIPLSPNQKSIWFHEKIENLGNAYIIPAIYFYTLPDFKLSILEKAIQKLVDDNQVLRFVFGEIEEKPVQRLCDQIDLHKHFKVQTVQNEDELNDQILALNEDDFKTDKIPLWRINLYELPDSKYCFYLRLHHLIGDGESLNLMIQKLISNYKKIDSNLDIQKENRIQYSDYVEWINNKKQFDQASIFWKKQFSNYEENLYIYPDSNTHENSISSNGDTLVFDFQRVLLDQLKAWSVSNRVSLASIYTAAVGIILSKRGRSNDFVIGIPTASRNHPQLNGLIGDLVNTLPLRLNIDYSIDSRNYIHSIQNTYISVLEHQLYPFQYILEDIQFIRKSNEHPLFNVMVSVPNNQNRTSSKESVSIKKTVSLYDLTFTFIESDEDLQIAIEFLTSKFRSTTIYSIFKEIEIVLQQLLDKSAKPLSSVSLVEQNETKTIATFNKTENTVQDLFSNQVLLNPDLIAVRDESTSLTYRSFDLKIEAISRMLLKKGLQQDSRVLVTLPRSISHIASMYAIWRAGGIYVPVDINLPTERQQLIKDDCNPQIIIGQEFISECENLPVSTEPTQKNVSSSNPFAYILYTSGTTGRPKGVVVSHLSLISKVFEEAQLLKINEKVKTYTLTNPGFDVAFLETVLPLSYGGTIVIAEEDAIQNTEKAIHSIYTNRITHLQGTPTYFSHFVNTLKDDIAEKINQSLLLICIGGESLNGYLVQKLKEKLPSVQINNHYGPTEVTIDALVKEDIHHFSSNSIGKPLSNTQAYVVDEFGNLLPEGVIGELIIGGPSVFSGYWNDEKNSQDKIYKFKNSSKPYYKTGDLVKLNLDGEFEFVGRKDNQIKLRGYRIELDEINQAILSMHNVDQVFSKVIDNVLISWVVTSNQSLEIQEYLRSMLPEYMIPQVIERVDCFPMTENGKISVDQLPVPINFQREYIAPRTELETQIVKIWQEVLGIDKIGVFDNFFELGGHSLTALQIATRIQEKFEIHLDLKDLLLSPNVYNLSYKLNLKIQLKDQGNLFPGDGDFVTIEL